MPDQHGDKTDDLNLLACSILAEQGRGISTPPSCRAPGI